MIPAWTGSLEVAVDVRFGSEADMCGATDDVCFTPNSDRESGLPQTVMSALPPKADMCSAQGNVCFGPIADIESLIRSPRRREQALMGELRDRGPWQA